MRNIFTCIRDGTSPNQVRHIQDGEEVSVCSTVKTLIRSVKTDKLILEERDSARPMFAMVRESVEQSPKRSTRKRSQTLAISRSTMMRVMTEDLGMFPYRIQTHQKFSEADRRKEMAKVLLDKIEESDTFLKNLWTTDEAHFHLDGQVNSKNNVYWGYFASCRSR